MTEGAAVAHSPMASDDDTEDEGFTVNEQFASKYEHEKARDEIAWRRRQGLNGA
eukprot:COSAG01_NODE_6095_length_3853_cov_3.213372_5_plen_54_part_00